MLEYTEIVFDDVAESPLRFEWDANVVPLSAAGTHSAAIVAGNGEGSVLHNRLRKAKLLVGVGKGRRKSVVIESLSRSPLRPRYPH